MNKKQKVNSANFSYLSSGVLVLENKTIFKGIGIGYQGTATGEVCFNTSLTGYQEILTDPSYAKQIVTLTYPHIGNTGTNSEDMESQKKAQKVSHNLLKSMVQNNTHTNG